MQRIVEYGVHVIVATRRRGKWRWFVSEKEDWFLDQRKFGAAFETLTGEPAPPSDREIEIVNENTADAFLAQMEPYLVDSKELRNMVDRRLSEGSAEDVRDLCPDLLVDFDDRYFASMFPEPASFEVFVPDGWMGEYTDFRHRIPFGERYWIVDGRDVCG